jgi:hypothetical protein
MPRRDRQTSPVGLCIRRIYIKHVVIVNIQGAVVPKKFAPPNPSLIITAISVAQCFDALYVWS